MDSDGADCNAVPFEGENVGSNDSAEHLTLSGKHVTSEKDAALNRLCDGKGRVWRAGIFIIPNNLLFPLLLVVQVLFKFIPLL
jgi:hypothetical protein